MPEPQDENLLHFLASTVESLGDRMESGFARLETRMGGLETRMGGLESRMDGLESRMDGLESRMGRLESRVDAGFTAVRGDIEQLHIRIDTIERLISARLDRVETEVSRLRSVVYLLVKDRPDLLRLLGETPLS
jgi:predicted  nucleic acid-binding Zn-ribbon protein